MDKQGRGVLNLCTTLALNILWQSLQILMPTVVLTPPKLHHSLANAGLQLSLQVYSAWCAANNTTGLNHVLIEAISVKWLETDQ